MSTELNDKVLEEAAQPLGDSGSITDAPLSKKSTTKPLEDVNAKTNKVGREMYFACYIPEGYHINWGGVWQVKRNKKDEEVFIPICSIRIMVTGRFEGDDGPHMVEITYIDKSTKDSFIVPMFSMLGTKAFCDYLIPKNIRVTELNLKSLFEFLNACIDANQNEAGSAFKTGFSFSTCGWKDAGCTKFVAGSRLFIDKNGRLDEQECIYGDEESKDVFNKRGSLKAWVAGVKPIIKYPNSRFIVYSAFSALLFKVLSVNSFSVDIYGGIKGAVNSESGSGKTTCCVLAMSGIGNMDAEYGPSLFNECNSTQNYIINTMAKYPDIPTFFDESTKLSNTDREALAYNVSNSVGRGRANSTGGTQKQQPKRGVALVTGERKLISDSGNTGSKVRVQEVSGGVGVPNLSNEVHEANVTCLNNSGFILELFLDEFFRSRSIIKQYFNDARKRYVDSTDNDITKRKAAYFAAIETSGFLMEKVFSEIDIPVVNPQNVVKTIWDANILSEEIKPLWQMALSDVWDWYNVNRKTYFNDNQEQKETYGWVGSSGGEAVLNIFKLPIQAVSKLNLILQLR